MRWRARVGSALAVAAMAFAACAAPAPRAAPSQAPAAPSEQAAPKRVTAAIGGNPTTFYQRTLSLVGGTPGVDALADLVHTGMVVRDRFDAPQPRLAEAVPTVENGLWKVFPDGRMETRWRLRPGLSWHDGTPLTTDDLLFTAAVSQDPELPTFNDLKYRDLEAVEATDQTAIVARWRRPNIYAEDLFSRDWASPIPRHLLAASYAQDKANLVNLPYWTAEYVGVGPYSVREWVAGSHTVLEAFDRYVMGRPKIDTIEVKFIPSSATLAANILAGAVEVTLGRALSIEQALQVRDQWKEGRIDVAGNVLDRIYPQWLNPNPASLLDVRMRRALLHSIDRQQMIDTFEGGLTTLSHSFLPNEPGFERINAAVPRYEHDPRRAAELIEAVGYARGPDGGYRDAAGQRLAVEIMASGGNDRYEKMLLAFRDYWERVGVAGEATIIPVQRQLDWEYRMTRGGLLLLGGVSGLKGLEQVHSLQMKTAQNNWVGVNFGNYSNAEMDNLIGLYQSTIPVGERMQVASRIVQQIADQVVLMPLYYYADPTMLANRLVNATARGPSSTQAWNVHEWDVR